MKKNKNDLKRLFLTLLQVYFCKSVLAQQSGNSCNYPERGMFTKYEVLLRILNNL